MGRFLGMNVAVTGASRGLGRAIAVEFAQEGARVGVGYRTRRADAEATCRLIEEAGGPGVGVLMPVDVQDLGSTQEALASFSLEGGLDVLVNNAAVIRDRAFAMMSPEDWGHVLASNLSGTYHCCRAAVQRMMARRRGAIVNVASVAGLRASPGQANYAASKGGVLSLTATLAAELAPYGIRVNAIVPGLLSTGMGQRLDQRVSARHLAGIPLARFGKAEEVARVALFLASDDASYIVGQCVAVDGGMSL